MPNERVTTDEEVVLRGEVDQEIGLVKVELSLCWLNDLPFHAVLGRDLTKGGFENAGVYVILQEQLVPNVAEVLLSLGSVELIEAD